MESAVTGVNKVKLNSLDTAERKICDGQVVLFRRQGSKRWQARIRRKIGTWVVFSTGQTDIEAAKSAAENKYRDIKYAQQMGRVDVTKGSVQSASNVGMNSTKRQSGPKENCPRIWLR